MHVGTGTILERGQDTITNLNDKVYKTKEYRKEYNGFVVIPSLKIWTLHAMTDKQYINRLLIWLKLVELTMEHYIYLTPY